MGPIASLVGLGILSMALRSKNIAKHKPYISRPLSKSANKPRIPIRSISHEDDGATTLQSKALLFRTLNAIKHLDFELRFGHSLPCQKIIQTSNERNVVCPEGDSWAIAGQFGTKHFLREREIAFIHVGFFGMCDGDWFFVSSFDQA